MAIPSGMSAQIGFGEESTWGTAVTVNRFLPLVSESLSKEVERLESEGIIAGARVRRSSQWAAGGTTVSGDVSLEVTNRNIGLLLKHALGTDNTTGGGPYEHVFTPGDLTGMGLTVQVGRPDTTGTVRPFTYSGCKVNSWELSVAAGEIATLNLSMVGSDETTATALASASLPSNLSFFTFTGGEVYLDSGATPVPTCVKSFSITGENNLAADRMCVGQSTIDEPLEADLRTYSGEIELEFRNLDTYSNYVNASEVDVSLILASGTDSLEIAMNARLDGSTPNVDGKGIVTVSVPYTAIGDSDDDSAVTVTLTNADSTP